MKKIFLVLIPFVAITIIAKGQKMLTTEQQQVQKTLFEMFQGIAESNIEKIKHSCTSDIKILENGTVWNLDSLVLKIIERNSKDYKRVNKLDFIETEVKGNIAWASYNNQADVDLNEQRIMIKWLETAILLKEGKEWKIETLHSTLIERSDR